MVAPSADTEQKQKLEMKFEELYDTFHKMKAPEVKRSTMLAYESAWNFSLRELIGQEEIAGYGRNEARLTLSAMMADGIGGHTCKDRMALVKQMLKFAALELGRTIQSTDWRLKYPESTVREVKHFTEAETYRIICKGYAELCEGRTNVLGIMISIMTGLRIGEVCGLRWEDIDFRHGTLSVRRTVNNMYDSNTGKCVTMIGAPKSKAGMRTVPMLGALRKCIRKAFPEAGKPGHYVTSNSENPMLPRNLRETFSRFVTRHHLPDVNFHGLRHTFATRLVESDGDIKTVSLIIGHADVQTTMNLYVHPSDEAKIRVVKKAFRKLKLE